MLQDTSRHLLMAARKGQRSGDAAAHDSLGNDPAQAPTSSVSSASSVRAAGRNVPRAVKGYAEALAAFEQHTERTRRQRGPGLSKTLPPPEYKKLMERTKQTAADAYKFVQYAKEVTKFLSQDPPAAHSTWIESAGEGASDFMARTQLAPHQSMGQTATRTRDVQLQTMLRAAPASTALARASTSSAPGPTGRKRPREEAGGESIAHLRVSQPGESADSEEDDSESVSGNEDEHASDTVVADLEAAVTQVAAIGALDTSELEGLLASETPGVTADVDTSELELLLAGDTGGDTG